MRVSLALLDQFTNRDISMERIKQTRWGLIRASHINDAIHVDIDGEPHEEVGALDQRFIESFANIQAALLGAIRESEIELEHDDANWAAIESMYA